MHNTQIDIAEKNRQELVGLLNSSLGSVADMYLQLKQAHWNVKGPQFIALHKLFDEIAAQMEEQVDIIAERITALGGTALGTSQSIVKGSLLPEYPLDIFSEKDHLKHLTHNMALLTAHTRKSIQISEEYSDVATGDMYIGLTRLLDKNLWFLEAHTQK